MDNTDELFGGSLLPRRRSLGLIQKMTPNVTFEQFGHKAIQSPPTSSDLL
jgi:hypothetical protein